MSSVARIALAIVVVFALLLLLNPLRIALISYVGCDVHEGNLSDCTVEKGLVLPLVSLSLLWGLGGSPFRSAFARFSPLAFSGLRPVACPIPGGLWWCWRKRFSWGWGSTWSSSSDPRWPESGRLREP